MVIEKILNNNVVVTKDHNNDEIIVMGLGIGYQKKIGTNLESDKIEKIFKIQKEETKHAIDILEMVPLEFLEISDDIINYAKTLVGKPLNDIIFVSLVDHIYSVYNRYQEGIQIPNTLLWDIKQFYKEEYEIGAYAVNLINEKCNINLQDDEIGFIALHFLNAQLEESVESAMQLTEVIQDITNIIKYYFQIQLNEESIHFYRYINHIKAFAQRLLTNTTYESEEDVEILNMIKSKYSNAYDCSLKIGEYIDNRFDYQISLDEIVYLTIHIQRLVYAK